MSDPDSPDGVTSHSSRPSLSCHRRFDGAVFETVEVREGHTFALDEHLALLREAAAIVGLSEPDSEQIESATSSLLARWGLAPGRLRIAWSAPGSLHLFVAPLVFPTGPARVELTTLPVDSSSPLYGLKTSGMTAGVATLAAHPEADEVLLHDVRGELIEGCTSNIFVVREGTLLTPPLTSGCRAGVTRSLALQAAAEQGIRVLERSIETSDLCEVSEAFLTSTGRHVQRIASIDGRSLSGDGTVTSVVRSGFDQIRSRYLR